MTSPRDILTLVSRSCSAICDGDLDNRAACKLSSFVMDLNHKLTGRCNDKTLRMSENRFFVDHNSVKNWQYESSGFSRACDENIFEIILFTNNLTETYQSVHSPSNRGPP